MLRTVTFSDPEVRRALDTQFVVTWFNQARDLFPGEPAAAADHQPQVSEHYLSTFPDGAGGSNVRLFFCTPDARVAQPGELLPRATAGVEDLFVVLNPIDSILAAEQACQKCRLACMFVAAGIPVGPQRQQAIRGVSGLPRRIRNSNFRGPRCIGLQRPHLCIARRGILQ